MGKSYILTRHVDYRGPLPLAVHLPGVLCLPGPDMLGVRHVGYVASGPSAGIPLAALWWQCCDGFCADGVEDCYVQADCFPFGPGPGITRTVVACVTNVSSCPSFGGVCFPLTYDDASATWVGNVTINGHTLGLIFACAAASVDPTNNEAFQLTVGATNVLAGASCVDPLVIPFGQFSGALEGAVSAACNCSNTDTAAEIAVTITANCRKTIVVRHVGFVTSGPRAGMPIFVREKPCDWDVNPVGCGQLTCGLVAVITHDGTLGGDCPCLDGTYSLAYEGAGQSWDYAGGFGCVGGVGELHMACAPDPDHPGKVKFTLSLVCGASSGGSATVANVDPDDVDTLDITFDVNVVGTEGECCTGVVHVRVTRT